MLHEARINMKSLIKLRFAIEKEDADERNNQRVWNNEYTLMKSVTVKDCSGDLSLTTLPTSISINILSNYDEQFLKVIKIYIYIYI